MLTEYPALTARAGSRPREVTPEDSPMHALALVVAPPDLLRDAVAACIRQVDAACEVCCACPAEMDAAWDGRPLPALVVVDLDAADADGPAAVRMLADRFGNAPLIALSEATDAYSIETALRAGALAFIPKTYTQRQMALVLQLALEGVGHRPHFAEQAALAESGAQWDVVADTLSADAKGDHRLTPKQVEVLSLTAQGLSNRQIAVHLSIATGTVKQHMTAIFSKLNVERRGEAIVLARRIAEVREHQMQQGERGALVLDWLLPHVSHRHFKQGDIVFRKGDPGRELFYLQRGSVVLEEIGVELDAGEVFGEIGVFAPNRARTCTARCKTDVDLFCLNSEQVKSIYYLNPQFALHMVSLIAKRLLADRDRMQ